VPKEKLGRIVSQAVANGVPGTDLSSLLELTVRPKREGVPPGPVVDKILEGLSKKAPPQVISKVTTNRINHLKASKQIVERLPQRTVREANSKAKEQAIVSLAESMARGVPERTLRDLATYRGIKNMQTLTNVADDLASLRKKGIDPSDARDVIRGGIDRGIYDRRRRGLAPIVTRGKRSGLPDGEIKKRILSGFNEGRKYSDLLKEMRGKKTKRGSKGALPPVRKKREKRTPDKKRIFKRK
jgi:hypothetical protein